jgi:hypothetical protein
VTFPHPSAISAPTKFARSRISEGIKKPREFSGAWAVNIRGASNEIGKNTKNKSYKKCIDKTYIIHKVLWNGKREIGK